MAGAACEDGIPISRAAQTHVITLINSRTETRRCFGSRLFVFVLPNCSTHDALSFK